MLKIQSVYKKFKGNEVLKNVNLEVLGGQLVHIKGINGSGKSTLLRIIAGLLLPDSGNIKCESNVTIGALIENPNFIETETMAYNLEFLYSLTKKFDYKAKERVKKLTELFSLDFDSKTPIKKFSLGMRQKVGVIQAMMENQNLILLDEPTRGLDQNSINAFNEQLYELLEEGKCIIICAHDGIESIRFTNVYEIRDGKLY